jgi:hypothetical protein
VHHNTPHWYDPSNRVDYIPEAMKCRRKWERYPEPEIYEHENAGYWPPEDPTPTNISDLLTSVPVLPEGRAILDWGAAKSVLTEFTVGPGVDPKDGMCLMITGGTSCTPLMACEHKRFSYT